MTYAPRQLLPSSVPSMIKRCTLLDHNGWLPLRIALWPDSAPNNDHDKQTLLSTPERYLVLIFVDEESNALGFTEASIRTDYVNGTNSSPVAFLEGLYVQPASRGEGIARQLVARIQQWAKKWAAPNWLRMHCWITRVATPCIRPWASQRLNGWFTF